MTLTAKVGANAQGQTTLALTFSGGQTDPESDLNGGIINSTGYLSLADGRYQLTTSNYISPPDSYLGTGLKLYRLYGDANGDGTVDQIDLGIFRSTLNLSYVDPGFLAYLDANNDLDDRPTGFRSVPYPV